MIQNKLREYGLYAEKSYNTLSIKIKKLSDDSEVFMLRAEDLLEYVDDQNLLFDELIMPKIRNAPRSNINS